MKMKKLMSAAMAGALALSLSVPAFASGNTVLTGVDSLGEGATIEVTGTTKTADVKVTVPTSSSVVLNPYELDYTVEGAASAVNDQIISAAQYIVNESDLPVKVSTSVTGTIEGTGDFAAADATAEGTKKVHLEFNIGETSDGTTESTNYETKALTKTATAFTDITMDEKGGANPAISFKFTGDAAENPTTPWTTDDIVGATIVFSFALDNSGGGSGSTTPSVAASMTGTPTAGGSVTLNAAISNIDASKNPSYSWAVTTDTNSIVDSFTDSGAAAQTVNIAGGATTGQSATLTVTVTYDDQGSGDATVTDTVTITVS